MIAPRTIESPIDHGARFMLTSLVVQSRLGSAQRADKTPYSSRYEHSDALISRRRDRIVQPVTRQSSTRVVAKAKPLFQHPGFGRQKQCNHLLMIISRNDNHQPVTVSTSRMTDGFFGPH